MTAETAVEKKGPETIGELLEKKKPELATLLPSHVDVDRFIKSALLAVARNNDLKRCSPTSLFTAIVNAAELGLDFTPAKGHAYLIPYGNAATFMPGYRGFIDLAIRSGKVKQMWSYLVYAGDDFKIIYGTEPSIVHIPTIKGDRGKVIGAYAVARMHDDQIQFEWMTLEDIDKIKSRSKARNSGPWKTDEGEMQRKTPIRRLFKYIPSSPDIEKALEHDNKAIGFEEVEINGNTSRTAELAEIISSDEPVTEQVEPSGKQDEVRENMFQQELIAELKA